MSQYRVPNWKLSYQTQEQEQEGILHKSSNLNNQQHNPTYVLPMSNYEVAELTWEKGQLAMHSHGSIPPTASKKASTLDTLESIVHQATCYTQNPNLDQNPPNMRNVVSFSSGKSAKMDHSFATKRTRSEPDQYGINFSSGTGGESLGRDGGAGVDASASANFDKSMDRTAMTWPTFESPQSLKTKTIDQDYGSENQDEEGKTRGETGRSNPTRRSRSASVHNQSERRRRDRINQKMKALQKLVPNSNKTDKASMLDEAIEYLKQLQAQVQMMSIRNMPQMMVPLAIQQQQQQQLQMSLLARMGMDMGPGMTHPPVVAAPIVVPHMIPTHNPSPPQPTINGSLPFNHPYSAFIAQPMNVDLYNKMAAAYLQQVNQARQATSGTPQSNYVKEE